MPSLSVRRSNLLTITTLTGAVIFLCSLGYGAAKARPIAVKSFEAPCELKRSDAGLWSRVKVGQEIKAGDAIRTGKGGKAVLAMSDGSKMTLGSNSRLNVEEVAPNRIFGLASGKVKSYIKKLRGDDKFQIKTPLASASVRGTIFEVGYDEEKKAGYLAVDDGAVALAKDGQEILVHQGDRVGFTPDLPLVAPTPQGAGNTGGDREGLRKEVALGMSKEDVMAAAAEELRVAEYEEGKSLIDVNGDRVRLEEYIIRRPLGAALPDNTFKLVVLNERASRFDYFYYQGVFNAPLPTDMSEALREMNGVLSPSQPAFNLTAYEMGMSNTQDYIKDNATGGHLVKVQFDGTNYILTDAADPLHTRTVAADQGSVVVDGVSYEKVYDPVKDQTVILTQGQFSAGDFGTAVYDGSNDTFHGVGTTDTFWRTSFNNYSHVLDGVTKQSYLAATNVLALDQDATFSFVGGGSMVAITETPSGTDLLHNRASLYYSDGTKEVYDTYIIGDDGKIAPVSAFSGLTTGTGFKNELIKWNYEQVVTATEFQGRKIDLVVEPKILIKSGIIK